MRAKVRRRVVLATVAVAAALVAQTACSSEAGSKPDAVTQTDQASPDLAQGDQGRDSLVVRDQAPSDLAMADRGRDAVAPSDQGGADSTMAADLSTMDQLTDAVASVVPNFSLFDVNPSSTSYTTKVSPRDYLGRVSAYYFTQVT